MDEDPKGSVGEEVTNVAPTTLLSKVYTPDLEWIVSTEYVVSCDSATPCTTDSTSAIKIGKGAKCR